MPVQIISSFGSIVPTMAPNPNVHFDYPLFLNPTPKNKNLTSTPIEPSL
jgi:hypothetical protein